MKLKERIEELEKRVRELEARPIQQIPYHSPNPPPFPTPYWAIPYWKQPEYYGYPPGTVLCGTAEMVVGH